MGSDASHNFKDTKAKLDYLKELLTDRNILANDPRAYLHVGKILEKEILRIRSSLFATYGINQITDCELPEPEGQKVTLQSKVYMPSDNGNSFNFVGRILGPDGSTAKCLQQCLGVKIMVRGRGSMRDRKKEEANLGKPNWEHLNDKLHVVLAVEDYENRAKARLAKASEYITTFLKESMKGSDKDDKVKQMQLMELAFRRAPCHSWRLNGNNLLDLGYSQKSGALFPNAAGANFFNFGYAYPPTGPLFSPLHPTTLNPGIVNSLGLYGQHQPQPQQHSQQQYSFPSAQQQSGSNQPSQGNPQSIGAHAYNHPFANNLNPNPFLLGHSPSSVTGYTSPFSPNSLTQPQQQAASVAGGNPAFALGPMNYWTGHALPPLTTEFPSNQNSLTKQQNSSGEKAGEDTPISSVSTLLSPCETQTSQDGQSTTMSDDLMQQYVLQELNDCHLTEVRELKYQDLNGTSTLAAYPNSVELQSCKPSGKPNGSPGVRKLPYNSSNEMLSRTSNTNGSFSNRPPTAKRYSQRQHGQTSDRLHQGQVYRGQGRSATVTVRIGTPLDQQAPVLRKNVGKLKTAELIGNANGCSRAMMDNDWPKLMSTKDRQKFEQKSGGINLEANKTSLEEDEECNETE